MYCQKGQRTPIVYTRHFYKFLYVVLHTTTEDRENLFELGINIYCGEKMYGKTELSSNGIGRFLSPKLVRSILNDITYK